jgi:TATA-binding protein-associated factor Taf7
MEQSCIIKASDCTKELTYRSEALERTSKAEKEEEEEEEEQESKEKKEKKKVQTTKLVAEILKSMYLVPTSRQN